MQPDRGFGRGGTHSTCTHAVYTRSRHRGRFAWFCSVPAAAVDAYGRRPPPAPPPPPPHLSPRVAERRRRSCQGIYCILFHLLRSVRQRFNAAVHATTRALQTTARRGHGRTPYAVAIFFVLRPFLADPSRREVTDKVPCRSPSETNGSIIIILVIIIIIFKN